jgi:Ribosomal L27 protein
LSFDNVEVCVLDIRAHPIGLAVVVTIELVPILTFQVLSLLYTLNNLLKTFGHSMLQPRIWRPSRSMDSSFNLLATSLAALTLSSSKPSLTFLRYASHASESRANGPKNSAGKRLGAKKSASQYVIPGNIIFKQRGARMNIVIR